MVVLEFGVVEVELVVLVVEVEVPGVVALGLVVLEGQFVAPATQGVVVADPGVVVVVVELGVVVVVDPGVTVVEPGVTVVVD